MEHDQTTDRNYWRLLEAARDALDDGDFVTAERRYLAADQRREASPGRVFLTESVGDALARLVRRGRAAEAPPVPGRWERRAGAFRADFLAAGEHAVREGVRLAELRPEDDAEANQPVLAAALFLVVRSRLFPEEFASAVPLLKGLFRTAARTGRVFDVHLIRHDVPLTEEDRLWLARRGGDLLEIFVEHGHLQRGSGPAREWAAAVLQLLQPRYFGPSGRLAEERAWLEAVTADRLQGDAEASVRLYRAYLQTNPEPGPRADEARVRTLELLANIDDTHFPVPRYAEALGALQSAGLAPGSEQAGRYGTAVARIEYRRPEPDAGARSSAWASAALGPDGAVTVVHWWGSEPRDLARWTPGHDAAALDRFLAACGERVVARDLATLAAVGSAWSSGPAPWPVAAFVEVLAEPDLPRGGLEEAALRKLAAGEGAPWRAGWRRELGLPQLQPADDWAADPRADAGLGRALLTGLVVLALRARVAGSDPSLRPGLAELARRGDAAAAVLYDLLTAGDEAARAMDASFAAWTVPLLWTRPDPFTANATTPGAAAVAAARPDLGRNDVALVTTGDPAAVLAAWGGGRGRWRVVLDRMDRLADLAPTSAGVIGPVTVIPRDGLVHRLDAALAHLDTLVRRKADPDDPTQGLLAAFHWVRIVSTHNGDLLDFQVVRPWRAGSFALYDRYAAAIADLARQRPHAAGAAADDGWGAQFSQRARKAGFVAGHVDHLPADAAALDGLWGVFEGSGASWVFLDAAVVHTRLTAAGAVDPVLRHDLLLQRGHRHLSLLTGAVWCREDLEEQVAGWLASYGSVYRLALTDLRTPPLILADSGPVPAGRRLDAEALASALAHVAEESASGPRRRVRLPGRPLGAAFWRAAREGRFAVDVAHWELGDPGDAGPPVGEDLVLAVPELEALTIPPPPGPPPAADAAQWRAADEARARWVTDTRRRCSLEIAALLAGNWAGVEILDARWWRLLRDEGEAAGEAGGSAAWNGTRAAALACGGLARCIELPETSGDARRRLPPALVTEVAGWCAGRGVSTAATDAAGPAWPAAGSRLVLGPGDAVRGALLATVAVAWERGRLDAWILVVSRRPWPEAALLAAGSGVAGCSVWPAAGRAPAPVVWARPADLADGALATYVAHHRPALVLVPDLPDWLPGAERIAQDEAAALRTLLGLKVPAVLLQAESLPAPWCRFLGAAAGVTVVGEGQAPTLSAAAGGPREATLTARLRRLLGQLRPLLDERQGAAAGERRHHELDGELVPAARLATLAGLTPQQVREGLRLLRWAARLAGDPLSAAEHDGEAPASAPVRTHSVLVAARFAELEQRLDMLGEALGLFLPLWLGRLPVGGRTWIDLSQPPARTDGASLARLDAWLLAGGAVGTGLDYAAPRGALNSTRRLVGPTRPLPEVRAAMDANLELFRRRVQDLMGAAVETGDGFLVDTGLAELRPQEQAFLALGSALDLWRWFGPPGSQTLPLVDLVTLADSSTVRRRSEGWTLVGELGGGTGTPGPRAVERDEEAPAPPGRLRALLGHPAADAADAAVVDLVARLAGGAAEPTFLVLRGLAGSGRLDATLGGLLHAARHADDPGDVTVHCPDLGTAAVLARRAVRAGLDLDLRLPVAGDLPEPVAAAAAGGAVRDDVVVMLDIQRFAPEVRYRIAQHGRGRRLLMTVDPAASDESWENLFLTTPRTGDILTLADQRDQARRIWDQVRHLVPASLSGDVRARRRERGELVAEYAANLDQCVARIVLARAEGQLPTRLRLTAPLPADLDYLAGALREQGWLVVDEDDLDRLFLPGACDLLAAATDILAAAGALHGAAAPPPDGDRATAAATGRAGGLLAALPGAGDAIVGWPPEPTPDPARLTLADLAAGLLAAPDLAGALVHAAARRRLEALLADWGRRPLAELPRDPLWQAWWATLLTDLDRPDPAPDRPLVRLSPAARTPAGPVEGAVYLCLGGEEARQHYRILSRVADAALVLYQDRSPLGDT